MLNRNTVTVRGIPRNYKEDLVKLRQLKNKQSTRALLDLAGIAPKGSGLPSDLSGKHNEYTWD